MSTMTVEQARAEHVRLSTFELFQYQTQEAVRDHIQACEGRHMQQVAYSSFHDALTQVCFGCRAIRTNIGRGGGRGGE